MIKKLQKKKVMIDFTRLAEILEKDIKIRDNKAAVASSRTMEISENDMKECEKQI